MPSTTAPDTAPVPPTPLPPPARRRYRRAAGVAGPAVYFGLVGLVLMAPFFPRELLSSAGGDLANHVGGIVEATTALRDGQFPLRVAPAALDRQQYPFFAFYGNLPYTIAGLLCVGLKVGPYAAYQLVCWAAYAVGGGYAYRCGRWLTRRAGPALVAGTAYAAAPYFLTDVVGRAAFPEAVSMAAIAAALFYALRSFGRRRAGDVVAAGVAWAAVCLSHSVTLLVGGTLVGLLFLLTAAPRRRWVGRMLRVGAGTALGAALSLWYAGPNLVAVGDLRITLVDAGLPFGAESLTPLSVLLAPTATTPLKSNTPHLNLQIGWVALGGAAVSLALLLAGRRPARGRRVTAALLAAFAVGVLAAWSPVRRWWSYLPPQYWHVQYTYRLLVYAALFGALLVAIAAAAVTPRRPRAGAVVTVLLLAAVGASTRSFVVFRERLEPGLEERLAAAPYLGANGGTANYLLAAPVPAATGWHHPNVDYARPGMGLTIAGEQYVLPWVPIPIARQPAGTVLAIAGTVPPGGAAGVPAGPVMLRLVVDGRAVYSPPLPAAGPFRVELAVPADPAGGPPPAGPPGVPPDRAEFRLDAGVGVPGGFAPATDGLGGIALAEARFRPPPGTPDPGAYLSAADVRRHARFGDGVRWRRTLRAGALVQLPALWYPGGLLRVTDRGKPIAYGNVGPLVAVRLPAGPHDVRVRFAGLGWANAVSAAAWAGVVAFAGWALARRVRKGRRNHVGASNEISGGRGASATRASAPRRVPFPVRIGPPSAVALAGVFGAVVLWPQLARVARHRWAGGPRVTVSASRAVPDLTRAAAAAFDGDPTTAWAVDGAGGPVMLTVRPDRPAVLARVVLEPRWTGLIDAWTRVRLDFYAGGERVNTREVTLPDAHTALRTEIKHLPGVRVDRVDLTFADPVVRARDGAGTVPVGQTSPGYTEIRLGWE